MTVIESGNFIDKLNTALPPEGDPAGEGSDHIRNIKGRLKSTFPQIKGAVTSTHEELSNPILGTPRPLADALDRVPFYTSPTEADSFEISDYARTTLMKLANAAALSQTIDFSKAVLKAGDTMTGTLTVPKLQISNTNTFFAAGDTPTLQFTTGVAFAYDDTNKWLTLNIGGRACFRFKTDGTFTALGDVGGFGL